MFFFCGIPAAPSWSTPSQNPPRITPQHSMALKEVLSPEIQCYYRPGCPSRVKRLLTEQSVGHYDVKNGGQRSSDVVERHSDVFQTEIIERYHTHEYEGQRQHLER